MQGSCLKMCRAWFEWNKQIDELKVIRYLARKRESRLYLYIGYNYVGCSLFYINSNVPHNLNDINSVRHGFNIGTIFQFRGLLHIYIYDECHVSAGIQSCGFRAYKWY